MRNNTMLGRGRWERLKLLGVLAMGPGLLAVTVPCRAVRASPDDTAKDRVPDRAQCMQTKPHEAKAQACADVLFYHAVNEELANLQLSAAEHTLRKSIELSQKPRIAVYGRLAECLERQGKLIDALDHWGAAVARAEESRTSPRDDVAEYLEAQRTRVWNQLVHIRVIPTKALPPGTSMRIAPLASQSSVPDRVVVARSIKAGKTGATIPVSALSPPPASSAPARTTGSASLTAEWPAGISAPSVHSASQVNAAAPELLYVVAPGRYEIVFAAPGYKSRREEWVLRSGEQLLRVEPLEPLVEAAPRPKQSWYFPEQPALGWSLVGLGLASAAAGTFVGIKWLGQNSELNSKGATHPDSPALYSDMTTSGSLSIALFGAGLATGAAGVLLLLLRPTRAPWATTLLPDARPDYAGLRVSRSF